jgi:putative thiamine transport system permease protein
MKLLRAGILPLIVLWALPLLAALAAVLTLAASGEAWRGFLAHPQMPGGLLLALWTGTAATLLALLLAVVMAMALHTTRAWQHLPLMTGAALALPHLAFAIGFGFLIMPSGVVARVLVGGSAPPQWVTTQDPLGLSLIAVLVLKEAPFLLLMMWSALSQGDAAHRFAAQTKAARSLGHGLTSGWLRVVLPQVLRRMLWPVVIVWVYGVTVVDLALVIGPTQPPTVAAVIWSDLNDAEPQINARGVAGAVALVALLGAASVTLWAVGKLASASTRRFLTRGPSLRSMARPTGAVPAAALLLIYAAVLLVLLLLSVTPRWPYPALIGEALSFDSWQRLEVSPLLLSIGLAMATSIAAAAMVVLWFESVARSFDRPLLVLAIAALALPAITVAAGQYLLLLRLGLTGTRPGLFLVHLTPVLAYGFIVLSGPYRNFDDRLAAAARALGASTWRIWWAVKAPLLKAPIFASLAVGFSVSLVQFVPAQLAAGGRFSTLPMEAVTLSSGGNRSLTATYALALALPGLAAFALAVILGRPRWR